MNISLNFLRILFVCISVTFMSIFMLSSPTGSPGINLLWGVTSGLLFGALLIGFDVLFKRFNLRSFNIAIIGIFIGYLMGQALVLVFSAVVHFSSISHFFQQQTLEMIKISLFLFGIYLGTLMTLRGSDELYVSLPFVRFSHTAQRKKDLIVDVSALTDPRLIDLCATGLLDYQLVLPRFFVKELYAQAETGDEQGKTRARKALEIVKKLETLSHLQLRFNETDFPEVKEMMGKTVRLARLLDANILSADISRVQMASIEGVTIINIHTLSNALKPLMQTGESIKIKIQRYGKEARQGVGYLEDGTMVVVNGGGDFIGEIIEAKVLSVKHTSSGRLIFCNASEEESFAHSYADEDDHR